MPQNKRVELESQTIESPGKTADTRVKEKVIDFKSDGESHRLRRGAGDGIGTSGSHQHGTGRGTRLCENYNKSSVSIKPSLNTDVTAWKMKRTIGRTRMERNR